LKSNIGISEAFNNDGKAKGDEDGRFGRRHKSSIVWIITTIRNSVTKQGCCFILLNNFINNIS
jgi:hypothetical protein